jgi:hypothetical protein
MVHQLPTVQRSTAHLDYTGYMLFPGTGLMRLTVTRDGKPSGQTVIRVPPPTS